MGTEDHLVTPRIPLRDLIPSEMRLSVGSLGSTEDGSLVGLLDEVRIYERELSEKEIRKLSERR